MKQHENLTDLFRRERAPHRHTAQIHRTPKPVSLPLPSEVFIRLGGVATLEQATWECAECGEAPAPRQYVNGFVPGKCACQRAHAQREQEERQYQEHRRWQQERAQAQKAKCYTWIGEDCTFGLDEKTFGNFEMSLQSDGFCAAVNFAQHPKGNLILWSDTSYGTGKTHLAAAIANYQVSQGVEARFTTAQGLFDAFATRMNDHQSYVDLQVQAGRAQLLVIDDLDKVHMAQSSFKQSVFFEVLNQRYLRHLPTVFTTNARITKTYDDVEGLSAYVGKAAASRLCDYDNGGLTVVEMYGDDYRRRER